MTPARIVKSGIADRNVAPLTPTRQIEKQRRRLTCPRCRGTDVWTHRGSAGWFASLMSMLGFTLFSCRSCLKRFYVIKED